MSDGLSRKNRMDTLEPIHTFAPIESRINELLRQIQTVAGVVRYYNCENQPQGYFDDLVGELKSLKDLPPLLNGDMEPSQAMLYTFAHRLSEVADEFNRKWREDYVNWYLDDLLGVKPRPAFADSAWIQLDCGNSKVTVPKGTGFTCSKALADKRIVYRLNENTEITPARLVRAIALHLDKNEEVYPANIFRMPIALHMRDLLTDPQDIALFRGRETIDTVQPLGLMVSSPSLLLGEGKRSVSIAMQCQPITNGFGYRRKIVQLIRSQIDRGVPPKTAREDLLIKLFDTIFYLKISTRSGWSAIEKYVVKFEQNSLLLEFVLDQGFGATTACTLATHGVESDYPTIKILLNHDAWLFPYAWIKELIIKKISIRTHVEGITNLLFYNHMGEVDTSQPFAPFGVDTGRGGWFVVGNYEMAIKKCERAALNITWHELPACDDGLQGYYREYAREIDARSFRLRCEFLKDYRWERVSGAGDQRYLFSTSRRCRDGSPEPGGALAGDTVLDDLCPGNWLPTECPIESYAYSIRAKSGFLSFTMQSPDMGFGHERYRELFTSMVMSKAFKKSGRVGINPPLNPMIDRLTLSYQACDEVDLRTKAMNDKTKIWHLHPLGYQQLYPRGYHQGVPFVYQSDSDANILFAFENVAADEYLNLYFSFFAQAQELSLAQIPELEWYWGDGYRWTLLPDESIVKNTTKNFLTDGIVKIYIPALPANEGCDADGLFWLRASVTRNAESVSTIARVYTNAMRVFRDSSTLDSEPDRGFTIDRTTDDPRGIRQIVQLTPFSVGGGKESFDEKCLRVSDYVTHRNRAVTIRDYQRMTLEAFPAIRKVKCMYDPPRARVVLAVVPQYIPGENYDRPYVGAKLLLDVESYFKKRSAEITCVDAVHPLYEPVMVRCELVFATDNYSVAGARALIAQAVNRMIAPWQNDNQAPCFDYSFTVGQIRNRIDRMNQVVLIKQLSILHMIRNDRGHYRIAEYDRDEQTVAPSCSHAVLVPAAGHLFVDGQQSFGVGEMIINENFVIWQNEIGKP